MKCKECKYYYQNGTCSTGVFKDLDNNIVSKLDLSCNGGSPMTPKTRDKLASNIACVIPRFSKQTLIKALKNALMSYQKNIGKYEPEFEFIQNDDFTEIADSLIDDLNCV